MLVLAAIDDNAYKFVLLLHLLAVVVGFAPAVVGLVAPRAGGIDWASVRAIRTIYAPAVIVAGLLGMVLVLLSDDAWGFGQAWISAAILIWIAMVGVLQALIQRGARAGGAAGARQAVLGAQILSVLVVVQIALMVFKPGA